MPSTKYFRKKNRKPTNTSAPSVTGALSVGSTLTCNPGTWINTTSWSYQWKRGATNVGTNSSTYTTVAGDIGSSMSCVVTGTGLHGSTNASSNSIGVITPLAPGVPTIGTATYVNSSTVSVSFTPGTGTATSFTVTSNTGRTGTGAGSPIQVTGLGAGGSYTFTVTATNAGGTSSPSGSVTGWTEPGDPYWSNVLAVLPQLYDYKTGQTATKSANVVSNVNFGGYAAVSYPNQLNQVVQLPANSMYATGTSDFTIEAWIYQTGEGDIFTTGHNVQSWQSGQLYFGVDGGGKLQGGHYQAGAVSSASSVPTNQWVHVAICRSGSTLSLFINGVMDANHNYSYSGNATDDGFTIGKLLQFDGNGSDCFGGGIMWFRFTKAARYSGNFSTQMPPWPLHG